LWMEGFEERFKELDDELDERAGLRKRWARHCETPGCGWVDTREWWRKPEDAPVAPEWRCPDCAGTAHVLVAFTGEEWAQAPVEDD
jgi:hypothetical protein